MHSNNRLQFPVTQLMNMFDSDWYLLHEKYVSSRGENKCAYFIFLSYWKFKRSPLFEILERGGI